MDRWRKSLFLLFFKARNGTRQKGEERTSQESEPAYVCARECVYTSVCEREKEGARKRA